MAQIPHRNPSDMTTALDHAHALMLAAGETEAARRSFFAALAAAELVVVLEAEVPEGADRIQPLVLETEAGAIVLAFDTDERMADFMQGGAPTAGMSGRQLAALLAPARLGLGLNLDVAPSAILLPADAMTWLAEMGQGAARAQQGRITSLARPEGAPDALLAVLDARLAMLTGTAHRAWLARATHESGASGLILALSGVPEMAENAISGAITEALNLAGMAQTDLDLMFLPEDSPLIARLQKVALTFDIPEPRSRPVRDPQAPPRLR